RRGLQRTEGQSNVQELGRALPDPRKPWSRRLASTLAGTAALPPHPELFDDHRTARTRARGRASMPGNRRFRQRLSARLSPRGAQLPNAGARATSPCTRALDARGIAPLRARRRTNGSYPPSGAAFGALSVAEGLRDH